MLTQHGYELFSTTYQYKLQLTQHGYERFYTSDSGFNMDYLIKNYNYNFIDDMLGNKAIDAVMFMNIDPCEV